MGTLRIILALSVVMGHGLTTLFGIHLFDAAGAVWVFFTISGFLITIALTKKYSEESLGLKSFYLNRLIRIYPIYWVWLLISVCVYLAASPAVINYQIFRPDAFWSEHLHEVSNPTIAFASLANLTGFFHDSFLKLGIDQASGSLVHHDHLDSTPWAMNFMVIGQFWSIGVELMFYAMAPWITKKLWRIAVVFASSSTGILENWWIFATSHLGLPNQLVYIQTPKYIWMFMLGSALAHLYLSIKQTNRGKTVAYFALALCMYATLAIRGIALFPIQSFPWWLFSILTVAIPVLFEKTSKNRYDKFLGELSYPIYICHFLLIQVVGSIIAPNGAVFAIASCATALALVLLVDRPAKKLKISRSAYLSQAREKTQATTSS